jgi:hypothetical protein
LAFDFKTKGQNDKRRIEDKK